jgi:hypothetical protein
MRTKGIRTYTEQMQAIANEYLMVACEQGLETTAHAMATWAIHSGRWEPQRSDLISQCADELARAMREDYITDPQGRSVRAKHAARIERNHKQMMLWADIRTASPEHMEVAFQQRRQQIVGDCRQLKTDVDSFNENRKPARPIQMIFDFTEDLIEAEMSYSS